MQQRYFAASNSAQGFKNYYPEVFKRADFLYIIKGGPGTGKSSFMKKCAAVAEERGFECEYYYCSSDPESLDGVLIFTGDRAIGILDGTAPHVCEPTLPGAREQILNFSQFWDKELLHSQKNEIISLSERKSAEYKNAYGYLRSVGNLRAVCDSLLGGVIHKSKMRAAAERLLKFLPDSKGEGELCALPVVTDSVSMCGRVRLDTFEQNAERLYLVSDNYGAGELFLDELYATLSRKSAKARISYDPVCPSHVDGIFIENYNLAFVLRQSLEDKDMPCEADINEEKLINVKRFLDTEGLREIRREIRYTSRLIDNALDSALHALAKARIYHFLLEDMYGKAMDWKSFGKMKADDVLF